ncbi:protein POLLEN DEFECTIVE IN GUIDANCE 1 isoform X1 [Arachis ipaensis]|uniref:protein POLLEN DEFECTIVE IN GUIDANCE 1 n=1 Tax=Arachis hypogaea TaxID=3818 RepID=UPI0007AF159F|nr:protein POLLEN DEFECTIVE IN GUIDANCE 1 isoform X1 [Arachis ipaensis]XP_025641479.1 protein POLLEN DEFECTIVE IN GUIDANCE 1 isoform X1 [Arachis hypogaea]QHN98456.1 Protein POLLEN DEFECTIVE IN GUIDANCE [Arachis hypogaea]QHN98457.1 Protein POLLEN DEFECTIVE IN GUIDANCE [Arachis hypogaea]
MALRTAGRKLSFDVLRHRDDDDDAAVPINRAESDPMQTTTTQKSRKQRRNKKKKDQKLLESSFVKGADPCSFVEDSRTLNSDSVTSDPHFPLQNGSACNGFELELVARKFYSTGSVTLVEEEESAASVCTGPATGFNFGELRQRAVNSGSSEDLANSAAVAVDGGGKDDGGAKASPTEKPKLTNENDRNGGVAKLETVESLDWRHVMVEDPNYVFLVDKSPLSYFLEEMHNGNSLRSTTTLGNEKERERVYDTIFRLPWRCELLIDVGCFVCFDSFLSLLTIMPTRIMLTVWKLLKTRQFKRLSAVELSDFGCFLIMSCGVILLQQTDISLIYHMIRGQGTIKLYVVYNVLEIFDKLCQSFNGDVLQTFFHSAEGLASCPPESMRFWIWRFIADESLAIAASIVHSFILLAQAITLSTCIVAHNNALFALLVSNNFAEIKSNVFKRYSRDNVHSLVYFDSIERFHISAFILFVLAQNILEAEGPWFESFLSNVLLVYVCEMIIDIIKHSFIAKFNDIKPTTYSEFLEDLCKQTLNMQTEGVKKNLTFVPLAPASVVIRVLTPVFSVNIPPNPLPWRLFWILLFTAITYVMLTSLKVLVGLGLQKHATWYVNRRRKHHLHAD